MKKIFLLPVVLGISLAAFWGCSKDENGEEPQKKNVEVFPFSEMEMTKSVNSFSMNFFATAYEKLNADENIVLSPLSLNMALAMAWNGANGDTRQGIQQAMGMQDFLPEEVNSYFLDLRQKLAEADPDVKLSLANSIWYNYGFPVKTDFITINKNYYNAEVKEIDFRSLNAPDQINLWCSDNTNGLIKEIISKIPADAAMYLINALYFKGLWADNCAFNPELTHQAYFNKEGGEKILVDMMMQKCEGLDYYSDDRLEMVALPYGNGAYSMIFALPKGNFSEMLSQLKQSGYWQSCLSSFKPEKLDLYIPKFKVEYEPKPDLNKILTEFGMEKAFSFDADFSGISDRKLFISSVKQKTYIEVDEKGTEAAAVTVVEIGTTAVIPEPKFRADRPFLFVIQENKTGTALFIGKIGNPE
jgi:serpin B